MKIDAWTAIVVKERLPLCRVVEWVCVSGLLSSNHPHGAAVEEGKGCVAGVV